MHIQSICARKKGLVPMLPAGLTLTDHTFSVPLDYADESKGTIDIHIREVVAYSRSRHQLPYLLFLQGKWSLPKRWPNVEVGPPILVPTTFHAVSLRHDACQAQHTLHGHNWARQNINHETPVLSAELSERTQLVSHMNTPLMQRDGTVSPWTACSHA
jgi:hypothetical protein